MDLAVSGVILEWRGPSPYHFVALPEDESAQVDEVRRAVTYGWGMVPVTVTLGGTTWTTSLYPKDGAYLVPLKDAVRGAEAVAVGDVVHLLVSVAL